MDKVINIIDTIASFLIVASFFFWSRNYILSNWLFWIACVMFLPGVLRRFILANFARQCVGAFALLALFIVGLLFFNKPKIDIKLPALPKVTLYRK